MFDKIVNVAQSDTHVHVYNSGIERKLDKVNTSIEKLVDISKDGFVTIGDKFIRISSITALSPIVDNSFTVTYADGFQEIHSEDEISLYNSFRIIADELKIPFALKAYMMRCPDCNIIHDSRNIPDKYYHENTYKSHFCPDCRKRYMKPLNVERDYASFGIFVYWPDGQRDKVDDLEMGENLFRMWRNNV